MKKVFKEVKPLTRSKLPIDTAELAQYLIGKTLVHDLPEGRLSGRIVETEAYVIGDSSGHAFRGETQSNRSLFSERGHAYVYFIYGLTFMLNITSEIEGTGAGVLLRALEPLEGLELMGYHRGTDKLLDLTRGPGRLATAFRINKVIDGMDLCANNPVWLGSAVKPTEDIGISVRIGISREKERLLRFYERGNPFVSGPRRLSP